LAAARCSALFPEHIYMLGSRYGYGMVNIEVSTRTHGELMEIKKDEELKSLDAVIRILLVQHDN